MKQISIRSAVNASLFLLALSPAWSQVSVLTGQYDNARTAANPNETILNTSNVNANQFGKLFSRSVDSYIFAQPLYLPNVSITGKGVHNVVYVATMHNTVYAFDADDPAASGSLWQVTLGTSLLTPNYPWLGPEIGILSTPVIDATSNTIYLVATASNGGNVYEYLHALDAATGQEKFGGPALIQASVPGSGYDSQNGNVVFNASQHLQRSGLLLVNGVIYIGFGSYDDADPYHGWLLGYNATSLQQVSVFNSTPNGGEGSIWQAGGPPAADANGDVYVITSNGDWDGSANFGESILRLSGTNLSVADWFTPDIYASLNVSDLDLGSSGALLAPGFNGTNLVIAGGKDGMLYVLDRSKLGQMQSGNGQVIQSFQATAPGSSGIWKLAYRSDPQGAVLYVWAGNDYLKAYRFTSSGMFNTTPFAQSPVIAYGHGGVLSISANGGNSGTGILWASAATANVEVGPGVLRAFDASNVAIELWNSGQNSTRDSVGNHAKFSIPTIANGKVYLATFSNQLVVYGLLKTAVVSVTASPASIRLTASQKQQLTATVTGSPNTNVSWSINPQAGTIDASGMYQAPASIAASQSVTVTATSVADNSKSGTSAITLTQSAAASTPASAASFLKTDSTTQGNWKAVYGVDGYAIANDASSYPAYAQVSLRNQASFNWATSTSDVRGLQNATGRIASTWYSPTSVDIDVNLTDGKTHQVSLYGLDWDYGGARTERIDILDANTNAVLDSRTTSRLDNGAYLVWNLTGHVFLRVTSPSGGNAVVSGIFFGSTGPAPGPAPGPPPSPAPPLSSSAAIFLKADPTTQGNWKSAYGVDGYAIANDATSYPTYAQVSLRNQTPYTWATSTSDGRGLQNATGRIASTWYSPTSVDIDINLTDGKAHQVSLYGVDWDYGLARTERIDVLDANTNAVLDSRTTSRLDNGAYLVWNLTGHVLLRVTIPGGGNAVVSGIFFGSTGPAPAPPPPQPPPIQPPTPQPPPPIRLAQSNAVAGSFVPSVSVAFQTGNKAGNLIVAFVRMSTTTQTVQISDSTGNLYIRAVSQGQTEDGHQTHIFYAQNIAGGANTIKAQFSSTNNHPWLAIYEYSGLSQTNPLDITAAAQGSSAVASAGPTALTKAANELVFIGAGFPASSTLSANVLSPYALAQSNGIGSPAANATAVFSRIGSVTGDVLLSGSTNWTAVVATFVGSN